MEKSNQRINVEVACALPQRQRLVELQVERGTTAYQAVVQSLIAREFPELDVDRAPMGVFSKPLDGKALPLPKDYVLAEGDRVEIYRALLIDPKDARVARAEKAKLARQRSKGAG